MRLWPYVTRELQRPPDLELAPLTKEVKTVAEQPNCHSQKRGSQRARRWGREHVLGDVGPVLLAPDDRRGLTRGKVRQGTGQ